MTGIGAFAAKEAAVSSSPDANPMPDATPSDGDVTSRTLHSKVVNLLMVAPRQRPGRSQPSARDGVWVNTAQPPDDPETSWPSTVFNPFASESEEMVVPTGPPTEDLGQLPENDSSRRLMARRRRGRHAAPSAGLGSLLARKLSANR
jgi:hypothetical protein